MRKQITTTLAAALMLAAGSAMASNALDTPGAPDAADGKRGATMGPYGGLAGLNLASPERSTPGEPVVTPDFSLDTPGAPDAADGKRGATMGPYGGLAGLNLASPERSTPNAN